MKYLASSLWLLSLPCTISATVVPPVEQADDTMLNEAEHSSPLGTGNVRSPVSSMDTLETLGGASPARAPMSSVRLPHPPATLAETERSVLLQQAQIGNIEAILELAYSYYRPTSGYTQSLAQAQRWFRIASEAGDPRGMLAYGYFLSDGLGGEKNLDLARTLLKRSADKGIVRATYIRSLLEGSLAGSAKSELARTLLMQAVGVGDPVALNTLGVRQEFAGNATDARFNYLLAARKGNAVAQANLDRLDRLSTRVRRATIQELTEKAADKDTEAMFKLAQHYHRGDGVQQDYGKAFSLYEEAALRGNTNAREMVQLILSKPRTSRSLPFNAEWMQSLSSYALQLSGERRDDTPYLPAYNDDPLWGLLLSAGSAGSVLPQPQPLTKRPAQRKKRQRKK